MRKQRLIPFLLIPLLVACGKQESAPPPASEAIAPASPPPAATSDTTAAPAPAPEAVPAPDAAAPAAGGDLAKGEDVYKKTCSICHAAGVAGAPKLADKAAWGPRLAQGDALLYEHAIKGFTGQTGMMPPKGGNLGLSDEDVKAGVDYMASKAK